MMYGFISSEFKEPKPKPGFPEHHDKPRISASLNPKTWASGRGAIIHWQNDIVVDNTLVDHAIDHVGPEVDSALFHEPYVDKTLNP